MQATSGLNVTCRVCWSAGLGWDEARDFAALEALVRRLRRLDATGGVALFLLALHGQQPRLTERHRLTLRFITR